MTHYEPELRKLCAHAWENEVGWPDIQAWTANFSGKAFSQDDEQRYALYALTRFMYFGKKLVREMLRALYRDHFESPLRQRIRRNLASTKDDAQIRAQYDKELRATRFIGVGNPAESGAHLLYYLRQVNRLQKDLFADCAAAFVPVRAGFECRESTVSRYVFFDDFVGSATQSVGYLAPYLRGIRAASAPVPEFRFMSLFATSDGLDKLNAPSLFDGNAMCLFELDSTYRAFSPESRYFATPPDWLDKAALLSLISTYGLLLEPTDPLGFKDGQILLGFSHNTPDNVPPVFWDEGRRVPWSPIFVRYDKNYGSGS